ncbi:glycosyl transferase [Flavobacterium sp. Root935]|jgi:glycosyltransferase involved in cell wall biosynthesis|uniref:tetratricopeptide repeat-containing glycosyltransferase family 2 protein n=1 Tax=Flavobacterium sp. Root935 TaxID=1736610 RepID=UPI00070E6B7D|nr:glycosyltransferase family 2 protein [Flavobacterium sp. Root935]KRD61587.1 glycosyl transferase [Flavobacterium sp. Root935]
MITISLCMIVKNEEQLLARCLNSVKHLVDEIIIIDTGSTDKTKDIAYSFTDKVYDFKWTNNFADARNFAFSKATKDYQFWLDADDIFVEKDQVLFLELKETLSLETDMVLMKYNYSVDENNNPLFSFYRERLVKRENNYKWNDPVHEYIEYGGNYLVSEIAVTHKRVSSSSDRNLKIYKEMVERGDYFSPRSLFYYARELRDHEMYAEAENYFTKFLETQKGSSDDFVYACLEIGKILKKQGKLDDALKALFYSFTFDNPRAEICCEIAGVFQNKGDFKKAIYWYKFILGLEFPENDIATTTPECWNFIPHIELAVCYDKISDIEQAIFHNEEAGKFKINHKSVLHNRQYFASVMEEKKTFLFKWN